MLSPFLTRRFPAAHRLLCAAGSGLVSTLADPQQQDLLAQEVCSYALQEFSQGRDATLTLTQQLGHVSADSAAAARINRTISFVAAECLNWTDSISAAERITSVDCPRQKILGNLLVAHRCIQAGLNVEDRWFQQSKNAISYSTELSEALNVREVQRSTDDDWAGFSAKTTRLYFERVSSGAAIDVEKISSEAATLVEATERESVAVQGEQLMVRADSLFKAGNLLQSNLMAEKRTADTDLSLCAKLYISALNIALGRQREAPSIASADTNSSCSEEVQQMCVLSDDLSAYSPIQQVLIAGIMLGLGQLQTLEAVTIIGKDDKSDLLRILKTAESTMQKVLSLLDNGNKGSRNKLRLSFTLSAVGDYYRWRSLIESMGLLDGSSNSEVLAQGLLWKSLNHEGGDQDNANEDWKAIAKARYSALLLTNDRREKEAMTWLESGNQSWLRWKASVGTLPENVESMVNLPIHRSVFPNRWTVLDLVDCRVLVGDSRAS